MFKEWKRTESRIGAWFGAKGIGKSGRIPLSGSNSGQTRSDSPHPTIFIETKRDRRYHSAIKLWRDNYNLYRKKKVKDRPLIIVSLPEVEDGKVVGRISDIWCIYSEHLEELADGAEPSIIPWKGNYPSVLTLYKETQSIWHGRLDQDKEIALCAVAYHKHPGFWIIINKDEISKCWDLILDARADRERLLAEEE